MKNIILANIGNRNLTYQGKTLLPDNRTAELSLSFRQRTLELLNRYEEVKGDLNEHILSVLLKEIGNEHIEKIVLFASDNQIDGDRNDQDTIHEAYILQNLFSERLGLVVEVVEYTQNITHNDELLRFYRRILRPYQTAESDIIICDAGGTAQQKAALKIVAEYLLDPARFSVRYVLPSGKMTIVEQVEYRRIIDEEQVVALVEYGQYAGALYTYGKSARPNEDALSLLRILANRSELFYKDAQKSVTPFLKENSLFLANFMEREPAGVFTPFKKALSSKAFFVLCERLEIAHFRYSLEDWSRAVLGVSIFIESFLNEAIQQQGHFKLVGEYDKASRLLLKTVIEDPEYVYLLAYFGGSNAIRAGLPLHLKYTEQTGSEVVRDIVRQFLPINSRTNQSDGKRGLDYLRNRLAHKGESVKETDLQNHTPSLNIVIEKTRKLFGLPEENTYTTLNRLLVSLLRS